MLLYKTMLMCIDVDNIVLYC